MILESRKNTRQQLRVPIRITNMRFWNVPEMAPWPTATWVPWPPSGPLVERPLREIGKVRLFVGTPYEELEDF